MESHKRTIAKAFSWRITGTTITTCIAWLVTGRLEFAAAVGVLDTLIKLGTYYLHERAWNRIRFGRVEPVGEYEI